MYKYYAQKGAFVMSPTTYEIQLHFYKLIDIIFSLFNNFSLIVVVVRYTLQIGT